MKSHQRCLETIGCLNTPAVCSSYLKKGFIKYGDLHLFKKWILYLHKPRTKNQAYFSRVNNKPKYKWKNSFMVWIQKTFFKNYNQLSC